MIDGDLLLQQTEEGKWYQKCVLTSEIYLQTAMLAEDKTEIVYSEMMTIIQVWFY